MDYWFLDNLEKLVPIVIALLYFLGTRRAKKKEQEEGATDPDAEGRARQIQEEIRRKILERQQKGKAPSPKVKPPVVEGGPTLHSESTRSFRDVEEMEIAQPTVVETSTMDFYEAQRKEAEERLRKARELAIKAREDDIGTAYELPANIKMQAQFDRQRRFEYLEGLRDTESIRHAIVLKEILDVPVALR